MTMWSMLQTVEGQKEKHLLQELARANAARKLQNIMMHPAK